MYAREARRGEAKRTRPRGGLCQEKGVQGCLSFGGELSLSVSRPDACPCTRKRGRARGGGGGGGHGGRAPPVPSSERRSTRAGAAAGATDAMAAMQCHALDSTAALAAHVYRALGRRPFRAARRPPAAGRCAAGRPRAAAAARRRRREGLCCPRCSLRTPHCPLRLQRERSALARSPLFFFSHGRHHATAAPSRAPPSRTPRRRSHVGHCRCSGGRAALRRRGGGARSVVHALPLDHVWPFFPFLSLWQLRRPSCARRRLCRPRPARPRERGGRRVLSCPARPPASAQGQRRGERPALKDGLCLFREHQTWLPLSKYLVVVFAPPPLSPRGAAGSSAGRPVPAAEVLLRAAPPPPPPPPPPPLFAVLSLFLPSKSRAVSHTPHTTRPSLPLSCRRHPLVSPASLQRRRTTHARTHARRAAFPRFPRARRPLFVAHTASLQRGHRISKGTDSPPRCRPCVTRSASLALPRPPLAPPPSPPSPPAPCPATHLPAPEPRRRRPSRAKGVFPRSARLCSAPCLALCPPLRLVRPSLALPSPLPALSAAPRALPRCAPPPARRAAAATRDGHPARGRRDAGRRGEKGAGRRRRGAA